MSKKEYRDTHIASRDYPQYKGALLKKSMYRGDSLGKKLTRFSLWQEVLKRAPAESAKFMVLAGREGADVACLEGLGVPISNIVGVDTDPEVIRSFQDKYPTVQVVVGDFAFAVDHCAPRVVYADMCGQLTHHTVCRVTHAARLMGPGALIAVTILKGREWDEGRTGQGITLPQALNQSNWLRAKELLDKKLSHKDPEIRKILVREQMLCAAFNHMLRQDAAAPGMRLLKSIGYRSGGKSSFVVSLFEVTRTPQPTGQLIGDPEIYLGTREEFREMVRFYHEEKVPEDVLKRCFLVDSLELAGPQKARAS